MGTGLAGHQGLGTSMVTWDRMNIGLTGCRVLSLGW